MKKYEKMDWIISFIKKSKVNHVDIFDSDFVETYIEECKPKKVLYQPYGANTVPELGRLLSEMYKSNMLDRATIGLERCYDGFPKWCYSYWIRE